VPGKGCPTLFPGTFLYPASCVLVLALCPCYPDPSLTHGCTSRVWVSAREAITPASLVRPESWQLSRRIPRFLPSDCPTIPFLGQGRPRPLPAHSSAPTTLYAVRHARYAVQDGRRAVLTGRPLCRYPSMPNASYAILRPPDLECSPTWHPRPGTPDLAPASPGSLPTWSGGRPPALPCSVNLSLLAYPTICKKTPTCKN